MLSLVLIYYRQRSFNTGQIYVALSRVKSSSGLFLTGEIRETCVKADSKATEDYERLRKESPCLPVEHFSSSPALMYYNFA